MALYTMTSTGKVGIYPVKSQQIDINTVGAGGGSIASYEAGQKLRVGPRSAGAVPGPACYGRGGEEPTVTDANVVLGCLATQSSSGGGLQLDGELAAAAVDRLAREVGLERYAMAEGIARIAVVNMTAAIKEISVMRGLDPRDFALMAYGGAGPLHATAIADELGIRPFSCRRCRPIFRHSVCSQRIFAAISFAPTYRRRRKPNCRISGIF